MSPISYFTAFARLPTAYRGVGDCGERQPAPVLPEAQATEGAAAGGKLGATGSASSAEGWALWAADRWSNLLRSQPGVPSGWGSLSGQNLPRGPPLGALRWCVRALSALRSRPPTALWGIQKGKADAPSGEPRPLCQASCAARGPRARQST